MTHSTATAAAAECAWCGEPGDNEQGPEAMGPLVPQPDRSLMHEGCAESETSGALATVLRGPAPQRVTGVDIAFGHVSVTTDTGAIIPAGIDLGYGSPDGPGYECGCGVRYLSTLGIIEHVGWYCPKLHPEAGQS